MGKAPFGYTESMRRWTEKETVGNSIGRAPWGRSETEATTRWTEGKAWEIASRELRWEGATTGWTERKPWEIVWGELRWEGAIRKRRQGNRGK